MGQPDAECKIDPAPPDSCAEDSTSTILKRCACKDAKPRASLRKIMSHRRSSNSVQSDMVSLASSQGEEYGEREDVQVCADASAMSQIAMKQQDWDACNVILKHNETPTVISLGFGGCNRMWWLQHSARGTQADSLHFLVIILRSSYHTDHRLRRWYLKTM